MGILMILVCMEKTVVAIPLLNQPNSVKKKSFLLRDGYDNHFRIYMHILLKYNGPWGITLYKSTWIIHEKILNVETT